MRKCLSGIVAGLCVTGCVSDSQVGQHYFKESRNYQENTSLNSNILTTNRGRRPQPSYRLSSKRILKDYEVEGVFIEDWEGINYETYDSEEVAMVDSLGKKSYDEVLKAKLTPREVGIYCTRVLSHKGSSYDKDNFGGEYWQSGLITHEVKGGDCDDGAIAAAALLAPRGFPPYILLMEGEGRFAHAVFLYKNQDGLYGSIGLNYLDVQPPKYASPIDLVKDFAKNLNEDYNKYKIINVGWRGYGYIDNDYNNDPR